MQINGVRFDDLNPIQKRILLEMEKRDRLAVIGGPGTGKTFIAIFAILKALENKNHSFFLVYNKNLNMYIRKLIGHQQFPEYLAKTYHAWLPGYLSSVLPNYSLKKVQDTFVIPGKTYEYNWPLIEAAMREVPLEKRKQYDFLFVDETQDIPLPLLDIIKDASTKLMVTFDDSQKIGNDYFEDQKQQPSDRSEILVRLDLTDSFFDLTENYRNTQSIERVAKLFGEYFKPNAFSLKQETSKLKGPLPNLIKVANLSHTVRMIYADFNLNPNLQVGVLFANTRLQEDTARYIAFKNELKTWLNPHQDMFFYKLGNDTYIKGFDQPGIYYMSMNSAKGLEFDKVYIIETDRLVLDNDHQANLLYVACTRSKRNLTFVYEQEAVGPVLTLAFNHSLYFNQFDATKQRSLEEDKTFLTMIEGVGDGE
jgi:superfamily I DNA/RNA helicase